MKRPELRDRGSLVYAILVVLGIGTLLPWNVFLTEKEFFDVRLHAKPLLPEIADNFVSIFGLVFNVANLAALLFVMCLRRPLSLRTQILRPLSLIAVVMASTAAVALRIDLDGRQVALYALPALGLMGACMAVLQGGMLNLASLFPPIYIQGYVVGAGLSGVATSVLSLAAQLAAEAGEEGGGARTAADVAPAACVYFAAAAAIVAACACCYHLLGRLDYSRARLAPFLRAQAAEARRAARRGGGGGFGDLMGEGLLDGTDDGDDEEGEGGGGGNAGGGDAGDDDDLAPGFKDPDALPHYAGHEPLPTAGGAPKDDPTLQDLEWWGGSNVAGPSASAAAGAAANRAGGATAAAAAAAAASGGRGGGSKGKHPQQQQQQQPGGDQLVSPDQQQAPTELAVAEQAAADAAAAAAPRPLPPAAPAAAAAVAAARPPAAAASRPAAVAAPRPPPPPPEDNRRSTAAFVTYACAITLTMAASLAVFPAVTAFICSVHNPARASPCAARTPAGAGPLAGDLFVPFGFVVFALGDLSGRVLSSVGPWGRRPPRPWAVALYAVARLALAAATLFCRVVTPTPWRLPTLLADDRAAWGAVFGLGLTQGHLLSTACMHAPAVVPLGREAEFGPVTGVCITVGCLAGSVASVGIMKAFTS